MFVLLIYASTVYQSLPERHISPSQVTLGYFTTLPLGNSFVAGVQLLLHEERTVSL